MKSDIVSLSCQILSFEIKVISGPAYYWSVAQSRSNGFLPFESDCARVSYHYYFIAWG